MARGTGIQRWLDCGTVPNNLANGIDRARVSKKLFTFRGHTLITSRTTGLEGRKKEWAALGPVFAEYSMSQDVESGERKSG